MNDLLLHLATQLTPGPASSRRRRACRWWSITRGLAVFHEWSWAV